MSSHVEFEQWVPVAIEKVFLFFVDPGNLPRIMPAYTETKLMTLRLAPPPPAPFGQIINFDGKRLAGVGSEVVTSFRLFPLFPLRAQWVALITDFEWNHHFADMQKKGPFKRFHHRHEFISEARNSCVGTLVRDVIDYDAGFGPLGAVAERFFITRQLQRTFVYRQQALLKLLT
jgi:ligand-binding SRPBCC domain-containing protein